VLLDAAWRPRTVWRFEAVLVLLGGAWPPRGLLSGRWPPAGCGSAGAGADPGPAQNPGSSHGPAGCWPPACGGSSGSNEAGSGHRPDADPSPGRGCSPRGELDGRGAPDRGREGGAGGGRGRWAASGSGSDSPSGSSGDARARGARRRVRCAGFVRWACCLAVRGQRVDGSAFSAFSPAVSEHPNPCGPFLCLSPLQCTPVDLIGPGGLHGQACALTGWT